MRVSTGALYEGMKHRIQKVSEDLTNINEKISSGKNVNRPSDDPIAIRDAMGLKTSLSQLEQYQRNIQSGRSRLELSESVLSQVEELVGRAQEIAIQMANDTQSSVDRAIAATEVGNLLDQAIALGNTALGGAYIFAGYKTKTTPFAKVVIGGIETAPYVEYKGDTNNIQLQIGKAETVTTGINGKSALMDSNLFDTLGTLKKALEENDGNTIRQQLDRLKGADDYLNNQIATIGTQANRLDVKETILNGLNLNLTKRLSDAEDADITDLAVQLNERQLAYQAALMASTRVAQISILNYL